MNLDKYICVCLISLFTEDWDEMQWSEVKQHF